MLRPGPQSSATKLSFGLYVEGWKFLLLLFVLLGLGIDSRARVGILASEVCIDVRPGEEAGQIQGLLSQRVHSHDH